MIRSKSDEAILAAGGRWDEAAGQRVIDFFETFLVLDDGTPFTVLPWMRDVIRSWYCWARPDGRRFTKLGLLTCGRKQAKSMLTYGLTAYHLIADGDMSPACASCAVNREQAAQIWKWLEFARVNNRKLTNNLHPIESKRMMKYPAKNGMYRSLASDQGGGNLGHGYSFIVYDEMAFFKSDLLWTTLKSSTDARPNGMQVVTSTAGWNKNGAFYALVKDARKWLAGEVIDTTFQPWIFEIPEGADLDDERNWPLSMPSIGVTQSYEDVRNQWAREKRDPSTKLAYKRLKFNQWTDAENAWINPDAWEDCRQPMPALDGRACVLGVDVGMVRDLTAISAVLPLENGTYAVKSWGFVPEGAFKTRDGTNRQVYDTCRADGSLTVTPGTATDELIICNFLDDLRKRFRVAGVVFDKWQSLVLANHCRRAGVEVWNFPQTHSYFHAPCLEFERLVNSRKIIQDGNHLLRWQIGHTYLDRNEKGMCKPVTASPSLKRDNLIATLMALSQAIQSAANLEPVVSVYETPGRGLL